MAKKESKDLKHWNIAVNLRSMALCHTFCNPDDVANFLLLEFDIGIEHSKLELMHEGVLHQFYLQYTSHSELHSLFQTKVYTIKGNYIFHIWEKFLIQTWNCPESWGWGESANLIMCKISCRQIKWKNKFSNFVPSSLIPAAMYLIITIVSATLAVPWKFGIKKGWLVFEKTAAVSNGTFIVFVIMTSTQIGDDYCDKNYKTKQDKKTNTQPNQTWSSYRVRDLLLSCYFPIDIVHLSGIYSFDNLLWSKCLCVQENKSRKIFQKVHKNKNL